MAAKQKRGKGKYAYQAKKTGGQIEKPVNELRAVVSDNDRDKKETNDNVKQEADVLSVRDNVAVMPVNIGKIDLIYEIKRIAVFAAIMIVLLVILFIVLK
ncbi:MAG: hypothetical protein WCX07_00280 [Dehalococcoidales bacterium]|jgi:hypothetical protein|nr:hypothetical protein [Dehalococcoidales bacterium]MDD3994251.1 hypothetical protein [Dehalococcoidales bacterium]NLT28069.1 hypothetical protein [Dehalococcoidales bacterium]